MGYENENMKCLRHCPKCGAENLKNVGLKMVVCRTCGFEFYLNTAAATAGLIADKEGKLLVTVRGIEPAKGKWDLPGGFVDPGELAEEAVKREVAEELGLQVLGARYLCSAPNLYRFKEVTYATIDLAFTCDVEDAHQARPTGEVSVVLFKKPAEIHIREFGFESIAHIVSRYLEWRRGEGGAHQ